MAALTWTAHSGLDYTVVMMGDETTDNASIRVFGPVAPQLAETIAAALNLVANEVVLRELVEGAR